MIIPTLCATITKMRLNRFYQLALLPLLLLLSIESNSGALGSVGAYRTSGFAESLLQDQEEATQLEETDYLLSEDAIHSPVDSFQFSFHKGSLETPVTSFLPFIPFSEEATEVKASASTYLQILFSSIILINAP